MLTFKRSISVRKKIFLIALLWVAACTYSSWFNFSYNTLNNYRIFVGTYHHLVKQTNLYAEYPLEYGDTNHYGPLFAFLITPFAHLPLAFGNWLWVILNGALLFYAVWLLPLTLKQKWLLLLLSSLEFANTTHSSQSNCLIAAFVIFSFVLVEKRKDEWATCLIVLGSLIKIYPIMALVFFMFSERKPAFLSSTLIWCIVFYTAPMLFSSVHFVNQSYVDWFYSLVAKNESNRVIGFSDNYTILGVIDGITNSVETPNLLVISIGLFIFGLPFLRLSQYNSPGFRLYYLSSILLFVVLFSSSSEHPTFIIAVIGSFLWLVQQPSFYKKKYNWLVIALLTLTGLGPTDAVPAFIRDQFIDVYAVKAWPCIVVWFILSYQLIKAQFVPIPLRSLSENLNLN